MTLDDTGDTLRDLIVRAGTKSDLYAVAVGVLARLIMMVGHFDECEGRDADGCQHTVVQKYFSSPDVFEQSGCETGWITCLCNVTRLITSYDSIAKLNLKDKRNL